MHDTDRATGKTTRILLDTASAMSRGERVLVLTYNYYNSGCWMNEKLLQILTVTMPDMVTYAQRDRVVLKNGGEVQFMARGRVSAGPSCNYLRGRTYDSFFSDVGQLTLEELAAIAPCIRSQSVVDIDINHFETEYTDYSDEWQHIEFQAIPDSDPVPVPEKKEDPRVPRVFSSR